MALNIWLIKSCQYVHAKYATAIPNIRVRACACNPKFESHFPHSIAMGKQKNSNVYKSIKRDNHFSCLFFYSIVLNNSMSNLLLVIWNWGCEQFIWVVSENIIWLGANNYQLFRFCIWSQDYLSSFIEEYTVVFGVSPLFLMPYITPSPVTFPLVYFISVVLLYFRRILQTSE